MSGPPLREQAYEVKYVVQTEEQNLSAVDAVRLYKEQSEVKRAFADLKEVLGPKARPAVRCPEARKKSGRPYTPAGSKYQLEQLLGVAADDLASVFVSHRYRIDPACRFADRLERIVR